MPGVLGRGPARETRTSKRSTEGQRKTTTAELAAEATTAIAKIDRMLDEGAAGERAEWARCLRDAALVVICLTQAVEMLGGAFIKLRNEGPQVRVVEPKERERVIMRDEDGRIAGIRDVG